MGSHGCLWFDIALCCKLILGRHVPLHVTISRTILMSRKCINNSPWTVASEITTLHPFSPPVSTATVMECLCISVFKT